MVNVQLTSYHIQKKNFKEHIRLGFPGDTPE